MSTLRSATLSRLTQRPEGPVSHKPMASTVRPVAPKEEAGSQVTIPHVAAEESLIVDARGELTPAQMVEKKLVSLLRGRGSLASHIQMAGMLKGRK